MVLNVKAFLEKNGDVKGEIRRFQVPSGTSDLHRLLVSKVSEIFSLPENGFRLQWQDSDGDFVTFSSTPELMEAIKHSPDGVLRLYVKPTGDQTNSSSSGGGQGAAAGSSTGEKSQEEKVHHPGVICDGCEGSIYGPRYKCVICPDYDLCSDCEQKGLHPEHDKFKITHPQMAGGPAGFMPPHFRRWMHRFMKKCQANNGQCPAGAGANASGQSAGAESSTGTSGAQQQGGCPMGNAQQQGGCPMGNAQDEYLKNIGENISAFLDPFGIDVSYEVRHGDQRQRAQFRGNGRGSGRCGGGPRMWHWGGMFGNGGGCTRMPQEPKPSSSKEGEKPAEKPADKSAEKPADKPAEKPADKPAEQAPAPSAAEENEMEIPVTMEDDSSQPTSQEPPRSKEASPTGSNDDDWTMLNEGETVTDGPAEATAPTNTQQEGLYPNLKVAQAVEMMKAMGFNDEGGWLTRLLDTTDGDIAQALDTLKLGAEQAGRLS